MSAEDIESIVYMNWRLGNVRIIPYEDPLLKKAVKDFQAYLNSEQFKEDASGTISIPPSHLDGSGKRLKQLFGAWQESGNEEEDLKNLYKSRAK